VARRPECTYHVCKRPHGNPQFNPVIASVCQILPGPEASLRCLDRSVTQQQLNLLQLAAGSPARRRVSGILYGELEASMTVRLFGQTAIILVVLGGSRPASCGEVGDAGDYVRSLLNQDFILRQLGDHETVKLKRNQLGGVRGRCDIAVQVAKAAWNRGTVHIGFRLIGFPSATEKPSGHCSGRFTTELEIAGFSADELPDSLSAAVAVILQTPEQYLNAVGVPFNLPRQSDDETRPTRGYKVPPKVLLKVEPSYSNAARQSRTEGSARFAIVVGTDGRPHSPRVLNGIGYDLEGNALRAISMYRFEPARELDKPVSVVATIDITFRLL
jgi:TonB family protein